MRCYAILLMAALALALAGCLGSEAPIFEEDQTSVRFEPRLVGKWLAYAESRPDQTQAITVEQAGEKSYRITHEKSEHPIEAHLVKILGYEFIDTRELPIEDAPEVEEVPEPDPLHYIVRVKETVYDEDTGAVVMTVGVSNNPKFVLSFLGRHEELGVTARHIEPEGNQIGRAVLMGETSKVRDALAALGDTVDGFGLELVIHLTPLKSEPKDDEV